MTLRYALSACTAVLFLFVACEREEGGRPPEPGRPVAGSLRPDLPAPGDTAVRTEEALAVSVGQTIYVPAYSHIYSRSARRVMNLTVTLSVRNTDLSRPLALTAVRYYDSEGELVRRYVEQPRLLAPLASASFVVEEEDTAGGEGASFIIEWAAEEEVNPPVAEAVMISTASAQGLSFTTSGRVLAERRR